MAALDDLINKIDNPELKLQMQHVVHKLLKQKKFGLVFEDHLPESTLLQGLDVRAGLNVTYKSEPLKERFFVRSISDGMAECISLDDTTSTCTILIDDLVPFATFGEPIYPYLQVQDTISTAPDSPLWHSLIQADNYHALQLLAYLYPGKVDCIYIDPPYNTGAHDWKYNNDYVDSNDSYRHSKWLSMMKKRLLLAKKLLNPADSVLIVTIDEKEYNHLGCLLEELFPNASTQMISMATNPKGVNRNGFRRCDEYVYFVLFGSAVPQRLELSAEWAPSTKKDSNKLKKNLTPGWTSMMKGFSFIKMGKRRSLLCHIRKSRY
ncbi:DNA methyltransferase [uncultured Duncaniella sp.]|uniref:DNA methyltransferase n=2 Tax=uncultured Duncaniella sp. TaxID=2768039 RepID=UPI0025A6546B|nr:DNA methyltransferase [uncultured Duncaniella sp.]